MRLLKIIIFLCILIAFSCLENKESDKIIDLKGNWYLYNFLSNSIKKDSLKFKNILNFNYQEIYFSNDKIYRYISDEGARSPLSYKIKKDSMFWLIPTDDNNMLLEFVGTIDKKTLDNFVLCKDSDSIYFYKLKNHRETLDKYIIESNPKFPKYKDSIVIFEREFYKRRNSFFKKNKNKL